MADYDDAFYDDYDDYDENLYDIKLKQLIEWTAKGDDYLKDKHDLTVDEHEAGKKELSKQILRQKWNLIEAREREFDKRISYFEDENDEEEGLEEFSLDYDAIDEAIERHQHVKKYGTDANFKRDGSPTPEEPLIISDSNYGDYKLTIKDIGETNYHNVPEHINGKVEMIDNGDGLKGTDNDLKELKLRITIPKVNDAFRCCRVESLEDVQPKYNSDLRSIHFSISSEEGLNLDGKFSLEYVCGFSEKSAIERQIGLFYYLLEISGTKIRSIDYRGMETKEEYDRRKLVQIPDHGKLHEGPEASKIAEMHKFVGDIYGSYPPMPRSLKGEIIVKFELQKNENVLEKEVPLKFGSSTGSPGVPNAHLANVKTSKENGVKQYAHEYDEDDDLQTIKTKVLSQKLDELDTENTYLADMAKIEEIGEGYLKSQDLTEEEYEVGREELAKQALYSIWYMKKDVALKVWSFKRSPFTLTHKHYAIN